MLDSGCTIDLFTNKQLLKGIHNSYELQANDEYREDEKNKKGHL